MRIYYIMGQAEDCYISQVKPEFCDRRITKSKTVSRYIMYAAKNKICIKVKSESMIGSIVVDLGFEPSSIRRKKQILVGSESK